MWLKLILGLAVAVLLTPCAGASAADRAARPVIVEAPVDLPPVSPHRNRQAQDVAASRGCWRDCQMSCKAEFLACGYQSTGAECLHVTDRCDRACQRSCRFTGDPLLDWPSPWASPWN